MIGGKKMKKNLKLGLIAITGLLTITLSSLTFIKADAAREGRTPEVFTTADSYAYRTSTCLGASPDSFEAWINLPATSIGGVIAGNYTSYASTHSSYNWEVDGLGRVKMFWDDGRLDHTFGNADIMDGKWHHVAMVRDNENTKIHLYIDGDLIESVTTKQRDVNTPEKLNIAADLKNFYSSKGRFDGKIKQVTVYNGPISAERVREDMKNATITTDDTRATLLGNWNLGEKWTQRHVKDDSSKGNQANLITVEKMVGLNDVEDYDYMFMVLPDVQITNRYYHQRYLNMMQWIVDNSPRLKNKFLMAVGDLSDSGPMEDLYRTSAEGFNLLNGKVPYSFVQGNHDYDDNCNTDRLSVYFNRYYPYEVHSKLPGFGGAYEEGSMSNTYYLHEVDGVKYCVINLEFGARLSVFRWAGRICEKFSDRRIIIETHNYVSPDGTIDGDGGLWGAWRTKIETTTPREMWDNLVRKHKNIFMVFSGHECCDDIVYLPQIGDNGNRVNSFLMDTQNAYYEGKIGMDNLCMVKINERKKIATFQYYSPSYDACFNIQNQFDISFADAKNPTVGA